MRLLLLGVAALAAWPASGSARCPPHLPAGLGLLALGAAVSAGLGIWRGQAISVWRDACGTWWRQGSAHILVL